MKGENIDKAIDRKITDIYQAKLLSGAIQCADKNRFWTLDSLTWKHCKQTSIAFDGFSFHHGSKMTTFSDLSHTLWFDWQQSVIESFKFRFFFAAFVAKRKVKHFSLKNDYKIHTQWWSITQIFVLTVIKSHNSLCCIGESFANNVVPFP